MPKDYSMIPLQVIEQLVALQDGPAIDELERRQSDPIKQLAEQDKTFGQVMAGQISPQDFFSKPEFESTRQSFLSTYRKECPELADSKFGENNLAAAWLTKLRFNDDMTNQQFVDHIERSENIFFVDRNATLTLDLTNPNPDKNDNVSIQWGIEALAGVQSFDSGVARFRFPEGVGPKIYKAFQAAGAPYRSSTHAHATRLENGIGKDVVNESDRKFTPRGAGHILMLASAKHGKNQGLEKGGDFDLVLKREDYGFRDKLSHTIRHAVGGLKKLAGYSKLINNKSTLAKHCEKEHGKGPKITRKEHLSELKKQSSNLVNLLEAGKKKGLFTGFQTKWCIRIALPPFEKKIVSASSHERQGIGTFLKELAENQQLLENTNSEDLAAVQGLLIQATAAPEFANCREGNEVMVDCSSLEGPQLLDNIAKDSDNSPVQRDELEATGMVTNHVNPDELSDEDRTILEEINGVKSELNTNDQHPGLSGP